MRANTKLTKNLSAAENWLFCTRAATNVRTRAGVSPYTTHGWLLVLCTAGVAVSTVIGWYYAALSRGPLVTLGYQAASREHRMVSPLSNVCARAGRPWSRCGRGWAQSRC